MLGGLRHGIRRVVSVDNFRRVKQQVDWDILGLECPASKPLEDYGLGSWYVRHFERLPHPTS